MTILPDNVRWLGGLVNFDIVIAEPSLDVRESELTFYAFIILKCSSDTLFSLEGHIDRTGGNKLVEILVFQFIDFSI